MARDYTSSAMMILGALLIVGGLANIDRLSLVAPGVCVLMAGFARRSARKGGSIVLQLILLAAGIAAILLQNDLKNRMVADPFPMLIIPLLALVAYATAFVVRRS